MSNKDTNFFSPPHIESIWEGVPKEEKQVSKYVKSLKWLPKNIISAFLLTEFSERSKKKLDTQGIIF